jgi:predicted KAP-like P-loop ATPase
MIPDNPISTKERDLLHRYPLASRIAGVIKSFEGDESLVVGIEGEWGSGKTSFINLILENLLAADALIIKFNPWNFSDRNELIKDFFNSIIDALKQTSGKEGEERAEKIKDYSAKLLKRSELTVAPEVSFLGLSFKLGEIYKLGGDDPLEKQKETINKLLKEIGKRIIIVIDDIDRLDSHETKLIFKLVKITANFANTIFLLAYDRGKVCERIDEKGIKGEEYLKKIIQVSFTLPKPDPQDLFKILFSDIDATIKDFDEKYWDEVRWGNLFHSAFKKLFPTIRDIKRYISSLRLDLEIIGKEEVNPIDFLGIEAIRVFAPKVYLAMADEKRAFTTTDSLYVGYDNNRDRESRKNICEQIITEKSPAGLADIIREIIQQLFPQVNGLYSNTHYGHDWQQGWRQQLRVCSEDIFDKYFSLSVPSAALSEKSLNDFLTTLDDISAFTENLKKFQEEDKLRLVLERLLDHLDNLSDQQRENLLLSVFDFAEGVKDKRRGMFDLQDIDTQTMRLGYQTLKRTAKENRVAFLTKILNETKSIFSPIQLVSVLNQETEKQEKKQPQEESLLTKDEISGLNKLCGEKIKKAAENGSLAGNKNLAYLLYRWKEWESEEAVKNYIVELLKTDDGLFALLNGFVSESMSQGMGDYVAKRIRKIDKKSISNFTNTEELDKRVSQIDETKLDKEKADLVKLYKNPPKSRFDD